MRNLSKQNEEIKKSKFVGYMLYYKWEKFAYRFFLTRCILFILLLLSLSFQFITEDSTVETWTKITSLIINSMFLFWEMLQLIALKSKYFSGDNLFDFSIFVLAFVVCLCDIVGLNPIAEVQWIMFLTMWMLLILKYIRVFKPTRKYVKMIMELCVDITVFLAMLLVLIFAYMHLLVVLSDGETSFVDGFKVSYMLSYGELDDSRDDGFIAWMNFMIFSFAIPLVMMNLLIAIMSDSYGHVMETAVAADVDIILDDIIELEELIGYYFPVDPKFEFFFVSEPLTITQQESVDVWDGVLGRITKTVKQQSNFIRGNISSMFKRQEKLQGEIDDVKEAILDIKMRVVKDAAEE